jgi:hypothetical protein
MRVFQIMGNYRLYKIECFHTIGMPNCERLKVTALNLFHPTASPPFCKIGFFHITTQSLAEERRVRGAVRNFKSTIKNQQSTIW